MKPINLFEYHNRFDKNVKMFYQGVFDKYILHVFGNHIRKNFTPSKKIFSIFIELTQNIAYYSAEKGKIVESSDIGIGTLMLGEYSDYYLCITGNTISNEHIGAIVEKCETINSLDRIGLRKFKREQIRLPRGKNGGGAHIGLIQIALAAENPLDLKISPVDQKVSFLTLSVKIKK